MKVFGVYSLVALALSLSFAGCSYGPSDPIESDLHHSTFIPVSYSLATPEKTMSLFFKIIDDFKVKHPDRAITHWQIIQIGSKTAGILIHHDIVICPEGPNE
jgi:hypothetical protein